MTHRPNAVIQVYNSNDEHLVDIELFLKTHSAVIEVKSQAVK